MTCMKCGKETSASQVFCDACLAEMQRHPVRPDIRVQLPVRPSGDEKASAKKQLISPETQVRRLRKLVKWLAIALMCSLLSLSLAIVLLFHLPTAKPASSNVGKNYSTAGTNNPS